MIRSPHLSADRRARELQTLADGHEVDVLVVGGGVTGAGVALDAAARGLSVALVERGHLASGTSRWSSKLAHGGLRYLAQGDVGVAWESARERAILVDRTAPHLVRALPMLVALGRAVSPAEGRLVATGLRAGDVMRRAAGTRATRLPRTRRIGVAEAQRWVPTLQRDGLRGALLSWDGQLEDDARLVLALARTAAGLGAAILPHVRAVRLHADGATVVDALDPSAGGTTIRARHVVNATGVWAAGLVDGVRLRPSKGSHLLLDAAALGDPAAALNVPVPDHFGRFVFAVPRPDGLVLVGLTDEPLEDGELPDVPTVSAGEERFLLETLGTALDRTLTPEDVVGRYAGLRPLLESAEDSTADVSRRHAVLEDPGTGVVTVVGGKLTTYRRMAQDVVDLVAARPGVAPGPCRTHDLPVVGATGAVATGLPPRLVRRFGAEAGAVAALADERPELLSPVAPGVPVLGVELAWAVAHEGAMTAADLLDCCTRASLVDAWRDPAAQAIERVVGELPVAARRGAIARDDV